MGSPLEPANWFVGRVKNKILSNCLIKIKFYVHYVDANLGVCANSNPKLIQYHTKA